MRHSPPDPFKALPLDERIRLAEQAVIDRDERVHRLSSDLSGRWHGTRMPSMAQGAGAGLLAGLSSWIVRRAFSARSMARRSSSGNARLDLVLQFLPLLLPVLPARIQHWVKPSRLMLGLALAAPLFSMWQTRREKAQAEADERALIRQVLAEQRAANQPVPVELEAAAEHETGDDLHDLAGDVLLQQAAQQHPHVAPRMAAEQARHA